MTPFISKRTLYICYFGLREPLVQTQVLPYLRQLATQGMDVHVLTFEPQLSHDWGPQVLPSVRYHIPDQIRPSLLVARSTETV